VDQTTVPTREDLLKALEGGPETDNSAEFTVEDKQAERGISPEDIEMAEKIKKQVTECLDGNVGAQLKTFERFELISQGDVVIEGETNED
jgi:hypothetical protein